MKRIAPLVLCIGLATCAGFWFAQQEKQSATSAGVAGKNSGPLIQRVSKTIRNPARSPAAASTSPGKVLMAKIAATQECLNVDTCAYPNTDPHSYTFAVGRALAADLKNLRENYGQDSSMQNDIETISRNLLAVDDGFVQEEALRNLALFPRNSENLTAISENLRNTADPLLIIQAMREMERYVGTNEEARVQEFLVDVVARGGQYSSEEASARILTFLNERTADHFRAALNVMQPGSAAAKNLRIALDQFDRMRMGA